MHPSENKQTVVVRFSPPEHWFVYDFELCADLDELKQTISTINRRGYDLISVSQDLTGVYTVFFKRRACG